MNVAQAITPFYFRSPVKPLFGCLHGPSSPAQENCAVLICQPMGHEYVNSHRALRQLGARLAESGFPVLRFDYYGTGDSYGNCRDGELAQWLEDISAAIDELKHRTGSSKISLVGLRLGAALACVASAQRDDIASLVLWDPVEIGKDHLQELLLLNEELLRFHPRQREPKTVGAVDLLGFRFSQVLISELERLNLLAIEGIQSPRVLIIRSHPIENDKLCTHLKTSRQQVDETYIPAPSIWQPNPEGTLLVPPQPLQSIVSWSHGVHL